MYASKQEITPLKLHTDSDSDEDMSSVNLEEVIVKEIDSVEIEKSINEKKATEPKNDMDTEDDASEDNVPDANVLVQANSKRKISNVFKKKVNTQSKKRQTRLSSRKRPQR